MQATLVAATSAMLLAGPRRRALGLAVAAPLMFVAIAARHNGIGAAWPLLAIPIFGKGQTLFVLKLFVLKEIAARLRIPRTISVQSRRDAY